VSTTDSSGPDYWFYHLEASTLEGVLPGLLEKTLAKGWRALVKLPEAKLEQLDNFLWTFREDAFLPHGREDEPQAELQPILLSATTESAERGRWKALKETGASLAYYQQNERGGWEKKA